MINKTFRSKQYDILYNFLTEWIQVLNPCEIHISNGNAPFSVSCKKYKEGNEGNLLCCGPVEKTCEQELFNTHCVNHCNGKGCTVKSLSCQQYFCEEAWDNIFEHNSPRTVKAFISALQYVSQETRLHLIPNFPRASKRENFIVGEKFLK